MADRQTLRPPTQVLTRGFDPSLSVGSARPAVFRSSTYVFPSPEAAERAFDLVAGRAQPESDEQPDLIYSRFNHPNAEILEARLVPLETGAHAALVFNSGMAAIMTAMLHLRAARPEYSLYRPHLRRHPAPDRGFPQHARHWRHSSRSRAHGRDGRGHSFGQGSRHRPDRDPG